MELYILNQSLEQIGIIDDFKSLIWSKRYIEFGDCEIYVKASQTNVELLSIGNYAIRSDDDMVCRITSVEIDTNTETGDFLIVIGEDARNILNQRVVWKQTTYKGQVGAFISRIITQNLITPIGDSAAERNNRKINNFTVASLADFNDAIEIQTSYDRVGDKVKEVCQRFNYGSKVTFDGTDFEFSLYSGTDHSFDQSVNDFVVFSPDFENIISTIYRTDKSNYASVALVGGVGEGNNRHRETTSTTETGIDRYEIFIDAKSMSNELSYEDLIAAYPGGSISTVGEVVYYAVDGTNLATLDSADDPSDAVLLDAPYHQMLNEHGRESLAEKVVVTSFDGEVEPNYSYKYGEDYFLGDMVQVKNNYGIEKRARITEVIESFDDNGYSIIPTFEYQEGS